MGRIFELASGLPVERPFRIDGEGGRWPLVGPWTADGAPVSWLAPQKPAEGAWRRRGTLSSGQALTLPIAGD